MRLRSRHFFATPAVIALVLAIGGCRFTFDRELKPGELRARVLLNAATGTEESWVPATNARFRIVGSAVEQKVGANGSVVIRNLKGGTYHLSVSRDENGDNRPEDLLLLRSITLEEGGGRDLGTLKMGATGAIEGRALLDGNPIQGAAIAPRDPEGQPLPGMPTVRSDVEGRFSFPYLPTGPVRLHALFVVQSNEVAQAVTADSDVLNVPSRTTARLDVAFSSPVAALPATLRLQVSTPEGTEPPSSITVRMVAEDGTVTKKENLAPDAEIGEIVPGIYAVTISAEGFQDSVRPNVLVDGALDLGRVVMIPTDPDLRLCDVDHGGCDLNADCTGDATHASCSCRSGFTGNGYQCLTVVNGCNATPAPCDAHADCAPGQAGEPLCSCRSGYTGDGVSCADVNECSTSNGGCDPDADCGNTDGSFTCTCRTGFTGDGTTCVDVNECENNNGGCAPDADCTNSRGSFACSCRSGFTGDGTVCQDINECDTNNGGCDANATCNNAPGSYSCACHDGYDGDGFTCDDVNECDSAPCDPMASCTNTEGSFTCDCPLGFGGGISGGIVCLPCSDPDALCCETPIQFCSRLGNNCGQVTGNDRCGQLFTANCGACTGGQVCGLETANVCLATGVMTLGFTAYVTNRAFGELPATAVPAGVVVTQAASVVNDSAMRFDPGGAFSGWNQSAGSPPAAVVNDSMWMGNVEGDASPSLSRSVTTSHAAVENHSVGSLLSLPIAQVANATTSVECLATASASYPPVSYSAAVAVSNP